MELEAEDDQGRNHRIHGHPQSTGQLDVYTRDLADRRGSRNQRTISNSNHNGVCYLPGNSTLNPGTLERTVWSLNVVHQLFRDLPPVAGRFGLESKYCCSDHVKDYRWVLEGYVLISGEESCCADTMLNYRCWDCLWKWYHQ